MEFANPILGLVALFSIPVILALHMFRRRFRRREVAGLFLWGAISREDWPGRRFQRIQRSASLICQLLAALLLSLLLAGPRPSAILESPHMVVVLDNSASMSAIGSDGSSFRDKAIDQLRQAVETLGKNALMTAVITGDNPEIIAGPGEKALDALDRIKGRWIPTLSEHTPQGAIALAREFAPDGGGILFLTNRESAEASSEASVFTCAVGEPVANIGFIAARRERSIEPGKDTVFTALKNFSDSTSQVILRASGHLDRQEQNLGERPIALEPGGTEYIVFDVPSNFEMVELNLPGDAFALDNKARLIQHPVRRVRAALDIPDGAARKRVFDAVNAAPDVAWTDASAEPDLYLGPINESMRSRARYRLGILDASAQGEELDYIIGPFLVDRRHPLFDGVTMEGVIWAAPRPVGEGAAPRIPSGMIPLVSAGDRVLLAQTPAPWGRAGRTYVMDINLTRSNIHRSPDWPIMMSNLVEMVRDGSPGLARSNFSIGESIIYNASGQSGELEVISGGGSKSFSILEGPMDITPVFGPGVYQIMENRQPAAKFAVNFIDEAVSDLRRLSSSRQPDPERIAGMTEGEPSALLEMLLIFLVCALVIADWAIRRGARFENPGLDELKPEGA